MMDQEDADEWGMNCSVTRSPLLLPLTSSPLGIVSIPNRCPSAKQVIETLASSSLTEPLPQLSFPSLCWLLSGDDSFLVDTACRTPSR
jgi:hypothetical protein